MALTTLDKVKEYLGIDNTDSDAELTTLIAYSDAVIKKYLGRNIEEIAITDETHETLRFQSDVYLREYPVNTGETFTITFDGDAIDSTAYELDSELGVIYFETYNGSFERGIPVNTFGVSKTKLKVSYTGGYDPVPDDIVLVATMLTADLFKSGGGGNASGIGTGAGPIKSERLGDYSVTYGVTDQDAGGTYDISKMLSKYTMILNNYRRLHV
jgi:hypothetical protein